MLVFKNVIGDNIKDFNFIKENLNKEVFPNLYLMIQVAIAPTGYFSYNVRWGLQPLPPTF